MSHTSRHQEHQMSQRRPMIQEEENTVGFRTDGNTFASYRGTVRDEAASEQERLTEALTPESPGAKWLPGFWTHLPMLGLLSLVGSLVGTLAMIFILVTSHQQSTDIWGYGTAPSVYLAIVSAISNALLAYALADGLVISFWRTALQGRTVGSPIYACVLSALSFLRGPLNQRASSIDANVPFSLLGNMSLVMAQQLPWGLTSYGAEMPNGYSRVITLTPNMTQILKEYSARSDISVDVQPDVCGSDCKATVKGFGFKAACYTYVSVHVLNTSTDWELDAFVVNASQYRIDDRSQHENVNTGIRLNVTHLPDGAVEGSAVRLRSHICNLTGSVVDYRVQMAPPLIRLNPDRHTDRFIKDATLSSNNTLDRWQYYDTMGGFAQAAKYLFNTRAVLKGSMDVHDYDYEDMGPFMGLVNQEVQLDEQWFQDIMEQMIGTMREIAFRTSIHAGRNATNWNITGANQTVAYEGRETHSIYVTDFRYMAAAAIISLSSIFAVALTFYGWWELGRDVSMSPLEIAKAFDAPLLKLVESNVKIYGPAALGPVDMQRVQYGEKFIDSAAEEDAKTETKRLVMGTLGEVKKPTKGETYGN